MNSLVLTAPYNLLFKEVPMPIIKPDQVLLKVKMVGICGTDVSVYRGDYHSKHNVVLGHEFCAEVADIGSDVFTCRVGDFVACAASSGCGRCEWCLKGKSSYCIAPNSLGRMVDGALSEYIALDQHMVYPLVAGVSPIQGQGVVGIATALRAVQRANVKYGDKVVIIGPGYSGLQILQLCKMLGTHVTVIGTRESRLKVASALGADEVVNIHKAIEYLKEQEVADVCFEASGTISSLRSCVKLVKKGGTICVFGTSKDQISDIPQKDFYYKEISMIGSKGGYGCYEQALNLLGAHKILIEPLVTHLFAFDEAPVAFDVMDKRLDNVIRAAVFVA